jgi:hypothetical protein
MVFVWPCFKPCVIIYFDAKEYILLSHLIEFFSHDAQ